MLRAPATMKRLAALSAFLLCSTHAFGYTECAGLTLTKVWVDVNGNFFIGTAGGSSLNGYIDAANASRYTTAVSIALTARASATPVTIRYSSNGITCGQAAFDALIIGIGM